MEKHLTTSKEATQFENDPDYITVNIVVENGLKYGIFKKKEEPKKEEVKKVKNEK